MWALRLNPMAKQTETISVVMFAETREKLEKFVNDEQVEMYRDDKWNKLFRKGSILEWYNGPSQPGGDNWFGVPIYVDIGTRESWALDASNEFDQFMTTAPHVY